jgi:hypothetical protein
MILLVFTPRSSTEESSEVKLGALWKLLQDLDEARIYMTRLITSLVGGLEHEFYIVPYIGNNHPN